MTVDRMTTFLCFQMREMTDALEHWKLEAEQQTDTVGKVTYSSVTMTTIIKRNTLMFLDDYTFVGLRICFERHLKTSQVHHSWRWSVISDCLVTVYVNLHHDSLPSPVIRCLCDVICRGLIW